MEHETLSTEAPSNTGMIEQLATRLAAAVAALERALPRVAPTDESVGPIVATVESPREAELERRLAEADKTIASLRASATPREGRRTLPVSLVAKQQDGTAEPAALDAALSSLSLEQRIAVKSQLIRAGLV
jgi:hypothetical protein